MKSPLAVLILFLCLGSTQGQAAVKVGSVGVKTPAECPALTLLVTDLRAVPFLAGRYTSRAPREHGTMPVGNWTRVVGRTLRLPVRPIISRSLTVLCIHRSSTGQGRVSATGRRCLDTNAGTSCASVTMRTRPTKRPVCKRQEAVRDKSGKETRHQDRFSDT